MATAILPQRETLSLSADVVQYAFRTLNEEREEIGALTIALLKRLEDKEEVNGSPSIEVRLMRMLDDRVNSISTLQHVERLITGVPA